jgi:hypothetical protein
MRPDLVETITKSSTLILMPFLDFGFFSSGEGRKYILCAEGGEYL